MFASMSFGMGHASRAVLGTLTRAACRVPSRRPHVLRPSHMRAAASRGSGGDKGCSSMEGIIGSKASSAQQQQRSGR